MTSLGIGREMNKPYSESCEQNKAVILAAIQPYLTEKIRVLEIGSGTGQHAVYFATENPQIVWQPSDRVEYLKGINAWVAEAGLTNLKKPIELDACKNWPDQRYELIFTANSFHIMSEEAVQACMSAVGNCLTGKGLFIVYGPFNYNQQYTSSSNQRFDNWLKMNDPNSGIKGFEWLCDLALQSKLDLISDIEMPANNRILVWQQETFDR
ncbi:MAG: cyclopropane fatty-acyl-phospholipid synthase-like methyltransferase [Gammaproteobacteria bacterium]|jgi:cyclopropane fatty-acyl-phospholipid synthase-like methyltransferase